VEDRRNAPRHGRTTVIGCVVAGFVRFLNDRMPGLRSGRFALACVPALVTLCMVVAGRFRVRPAAWHLAGLEMLLVSASACWRMQQFRRLRASS
jgi:hypothetical protein